MDDFRTINRSEYHGLEGVSSAAAQNAFINRVYGWMSAALALTGVVAYFVAQNPGWIKTIYQNPILFWGILIGQLLLVMGLSGAINRISASTALLGFILYAALNGLIFSGIFLVYTKASLASTFFATSLTFGVT
ncbi:MAG: Bax inhibitor-1 family protein, partial [Victivallaceae bacterium]